MERPRGVMFFGVIYIIFGVLIALASLFVGIVFFLLQYVYPSLVPYTYPISFSIFMWVLVLIGLAVGIFEIIVGINLLKLIRWARIAMIIISIIGIVFSLIFFIVAVIMTGTWVIYFLSLILQLIVPVLALWYLNKYEIKWLFGEKY